MSTSEIECCFKQILSGIDYLHGQGVAHRDIKPENLFFDGKGALKVSLVSEAANILSLSVFRLGTTVHLSFTASLGRALFICPLAYVAVNLILLQSSSLVNVCLDRHPRHLCPNATFQRTMRVSWTFGLVASFTIVCNSKSSLGVLPKLRTRYTPLTPKLPRVRSQTLLQAERVPPRSTPFRQGRPDLSSVNCWSQIQRSVTISRTCYHRAGCRASKYA